MATGDGGRPTFRAPYQARARFTIGDTSSNDLLAKRLNARPPGTLEPPRFRFWRPTRQTRAIMDVDDADDDGDFHDELMDGDDGDGVIEDDTAEAKGYDLLKLAEELRALRFDLKGDNPELGGVANKHTEHDKNLLYIIRAVIVDTLGIKKTDGPGGTIVYSDFRDPPAYTEPELLTPDHIVIAWHLGMGHPFNRRATKLLADKIIHHPDWAKYFTNVTDEMRHGIAIGVNTHLKYLAKIYNNIGWARLQVTDEQRATLKLAQVIKKENKAADERRRMLLKWRKDTCLFYGHHDWVALLDHATAASMSSDDGSERNDQRRLADRVYYVSAKTWRNPDFIEWLRTLDRCGRKREESSKTRGRSFRIRRPASSSIGLRESTRQPTPRLIEQMYSLPVCKKHGPRHRYPIVALVTLEQALVDVTALALSLGVNNGDI
ncbi:hypothetical protein BKA62DRAFT_765657 [Auriculariales sp. MPI-PUGE-AT-0066]|nr:hypothetical protein BKA62DRAFT_765657 [Auriculariales sp. MPI-PUGE-AT-0066]